MNPFPVFLLIIGIADLIHRLIPEKTNIRFHDSTKTAFYINHEAERNARINQLTTEQSKRRLDEMFN